MKMSPKIYAKAKSISSLATTWNLGGGFKYVLFLTPIWENDSHFDSSFSDGLVQPPTSEYVYSPN